MTQRLRDIRIKAGLTQAELAEKASKVRINNQQGDIDQQTISRLESGQVQDPGHCTVIRISRALGIEPCRVQEFQC